MSNTNSLNISMDAAAKRYSSLFKLPPYRRVLLFQVLIFAIGLSLTAFITFPVALGISGAAALGFSTLLINTMFDYLVSAWILKEDPVFDFRRTATLSLCCWVVWLFFIFIGSVLSAQFGQLWWIRFVLLGFSAVLIFRSIVLKATSTVSSFRILAASFLQPLSCIIPFLVVWSNTGHTFTLQFWAFFPFAVTVAMLASHLFTSSLDSLGTITLGITSLSILKAFLLNWIIGMNGPIERVLETIGEEQDTSISLFKFAGAKTSVIVAVPSIHPGPFKNVGSSPLPSLLKAHLEKNPNCVACVPHGLLGHEVDLASQAENQKVIDSTMEKAGFPVTETGATPLVTARVRSATASCQVFGKCALISFTLAPETTEDLPIELGTFVHQEAAKLGIEQCVIINAHNSISTESNTEGALESLKEAAVECLREAVSIRQIPFEVGAGSVFPAEYGLEDGMGAGGITVVKFKVGPENVCYVVIDGNNMISGLRERIQSSLADNGICRTEIFTTDTHSVSAIVLTARGYNPVGETIDPAVLIGYIKQALVLATKGMENSQSGCCEVQLSKVRVIGEKQLELLCMLIDRCLRRAKRIVMPLLVGSGLLLILFLLLL